jgi:hypothetical protein
MDMKELTAYCGNLCAECPAYIATQADDAQALADVAAQWREEYDSPEITVEAVVCDGCTVESERHCSWWHQCPVRACASERGVLTCAHCDEYVCEKLAPVIDMMPQQREVLETIRASL